MAGGHAPERVGPIVTVEGVPFLAEIFAPGATPEATRAQAEMLRQMYAALTPEQFAAFNRTQLASLITDAGEVDRVARSSGRSDPAAVGQAVYELMTTDLRPALPAVRAPVLLILGGIFGPDAARAIGERQLSNLGDHRVEVIDHARHFAMLDAPEAFFARVEKFLADAKLPVAP